MKRKVSTGYEHEHDRAAMPVVAQSARVRLLSSVLSAPIHLYRYAISPLLPASCRFYPSCSEYALECLRRHGPLAGSWLAVTRICRCHPWNDGGLDPVPDTFAPLARLSRWPSAQRDEPPARTD